MDALICADGDFELRWIDRQWIHITKLEHGGHWHTDAAGEDQNEDYLARKVIPHSCLFFIGTKKRR